MKRLFSLAALAVALFGCGPADPALSHTEVRLALDFSADALLELFVVDESTASCADLSGGRDPNDDSVTVHALDRQPARGLNGGGEIRFQLDELPAEVPLVFFARAVEGGVALARDCEEGVVVPSGGTLDVSLVVAEP